MCICVYHVFIPKLDAVFCFHLVFLEGQVCSKCYLMSQEGRNKFEFSKQRL